MRILIRIAVAVAAVLSLFTTLVFAADLQPPDMKCVIGHFTVPSTIASRVAGFAADDFLVKSVDIPDDVLVALEKCTTLHRRAVGSDFYLPLPFAGGKPWPRKVMVLACTNNGLFVFKKTVAPDADFTFTFGPGNKIAKSNPLSKRC